MRERKRERADESEPLRHLILIESSSSNIGIGPDITGYRASRSVRARDRDRELNSEKCVQHGPSERNGAVLCGSPEEFATLAPAAAAAAADSISGSTPCTRVVWCTDGRCGAFDVVIASHHNHLYHLRRPRTAFDRFRQHLSSVRLALAFKYRSIHTRKRKQRNAKTSPRSVAY